MDAYKLFRIGGDYATNSEEKRVVDAAPRCKLLLDCFAQHVNEIPLAADEIVETPLRGQRPPPPGCVRIGLELAMLPDGDVILIQLVTISCNNDHSVNVNRLLEEHDILVRPERFSIVKSPVVFTPGFKERMRQRFTAK
jgi:hypothetical protein